MKIVEQIAKQAFQVDKLYDQASSAGIDGNYNIVGYYEDEHSLGVIATVVYKPCDIRIYDTAYHAVDKLFEKKYLVLKDGTIKKPDNTTLEFYEEEDENIRNYYSSELEKLENLLAGYKGDNSELKRYRVWAKMTSYCYIEVEAMSETDAIKIAEDTDGGEFITCDDGDWEVTEANEI